MKSTSRHQSVNLEDRADHQDPGLDIRPSGRFAECKSGRCTDRPSVARAKTCRHEPNKRSTDEKNLRTPTRCHDVMFSKWREIIIDTKRENEMIKVRLDANIKNFPRLCAPFTRFSLRSTSKAYFEVESSEVKTSNPHMVAACTVYHPEFVHTDNNKVNF